jgi:hypothetical protein
MSQELSLADVGILKSAAGGCSCGGSKFTYRLPIKITEGIFSLLLQFGELNSDVAMSHLIRINTPDYKISAIKRLKDIEYTLKRQDAVLLQQAFENALINYVQSVAEEKK